MLFYRPSKDDVHKEDKLKILLLALGLLVSGTTLALEIETSFLSKYAFDRNGAEPTHFVLKGSIDKGDLEKIQRFLKSRQGKDTIFSINSNGGYVSEAINIGLFFRDIFMELDVEYQCDSACFYVLAGAYKRSTSYPVGLHRPYFQANQYANLSPKESEVAFSNVLKLVKGYLEQVHVSPVVIDGMMKASPREMMYVQPEDFEQLIGSYSPVKKDWLTAKCDNRTPAELEEWRLIVDMRFYLSTLKDYAQIYQSPMGLYEAVQELNHKYQETIAAHKANKNLLFAEPTLSKKQSEISICQWETVRKEREKILRDLTL